MINESLEKNYVVSKLRPNLAGLMEDWARRSADYRNNADAQYDCQYGDHAREKIDIFRGGEKQAPLLIYLHGGYWQRGDKSMYSFIAKPFNANGIDVAIVGYPLCPQVSLTALVESVRQAVMFLYRQSETLGLSQNRFNLCGSSAGGQLVAMMMASRWSEFDNSLPDDLIKFGAPISALYALEPLRQTTLNDAIGLDADEARANSPHFLKPVSDAPVLTAVGGAETPVFYEQMQSFVQQWQTDSQLIEQHIEQHIEPNADHFDIIDKLGDEQSQIFQQILQRLR